MTIEIVSTVVALFFISRAMVRIKKRELSLREGIAWMVLWACVGFIVLYPKVADYAAGAIGLKTATGIDLVVYIAVAVLFYLLFRIFVRIERIEHNITELVRKTALDAREKKDDE